MYLLQDIFNWIKLNRLAIMLMLTSIGIALLCPIIYFISGNTTSHPSPEAFGEFPLKEVWAFQADGMIIPPPGTGNNEVYIRTMMAVYSIDIISGLYQWDMKFQSNGGPSIPVEASSLVIVGNNSEIRAIDSKSGELVWRNVIDSYGDVSIQAYSKDMVIVNRVAIAVDAFNLQTGKLEWEVITGRGRADAYIDNNTIYLVFGGQLQARKLSTGSLLWKESIGFTGRSAFSGGLLYYRVIEDEGKTAVVAFDVHRRVESWRAELTTDINQMTIEDNYLLLGAESAIIAINAISGKIFWEANLNFDSYQSPLLLGKVIYVKGLFSKKIYALSTENGLVLGYLQAGSPQFINKDYGGVNRWVDLANGMNLLIFTIGDKVYGYGE